MGRHTVALTHGANIMPIKKVYRPTIRKDGAGYIIEVAAETTDSSDSLTGGLIYIAAFRGGTLGIETTRLSPGTVNRNEEWAIKAGVEHARATRLADSETIRDLTTALRGLLATTDRFVVIQPGCNGAAELTHARVLARAALGE